MSFEDASNGNLPLASAALGAGTTALGFSSTVLPGAGSEPIPAAVGDFNGDGIPDVVVGDINPNSGAYTLILYLSSGIGTFAPPTSITLPASFMNPTALAIGDFNNDGNLDLAVAGANVNQVLVLLAWETVLS